MFLFLVERTVLVGKNPCFTPSFCSNKKEKALKTISFSKLFPYLCLFLLRLRKNEVENYADDGGEADAGNGEGTG